ncbi:MAG: glycoside hydrolase family 78 protein [Bacteroidales bacterium]|jgi:alpha-L-rhamnosidase|nr:glycoside hydrolase family 78 protein [Bacteroidales bacterium]
MYKKLGYLFLYLLIACSPMPDPEAPDDLKCCFLTEPLSVDTSEPLLAWKLPIAMPTMKQAAYQIIAATDAKLLKEGKADLWDSGKTLSDNRTAVKYGGKALAGNKLVYWKVRVWDENDKPSAWSAPTRFGAGLTDSELNRAEYIAARPEAVSASNTSQKGVPSPLLRKQFDWSGGDALLYVNSLGYHEVFINGKKVGDCVLAPAMTQFNKRSLYVTYDVTPYLTKGSNDLVLWLASGWYHKGRPGVVYDGPVAKALLSVKSGNQWDNILHTDASWMCAPSGYETLGEWRYHSFGGESINAAVLNNDLSAKSLDELQWTSVEKVDIPAHAVTPQMTEGNVIAEEIKPVSVKQLADNVWLADMGKVFTGRAEIKMDRLVAGGEVRFFFGDHFNANGTLEFENQRDFYLARGNDDVFCSRFNYHCFQYIRIEGVYATITPDDITGYPIQTGFSGQSSFECSDPELNAIHDMVQWTLRNLSLGGYIVDCAHIERLGYGGDGHASTVTAQTMFNLAPLYANWLQAWQDCIREDGGLPHTAPNPYPAGGGPYWCAFIVSAPWSTYLNYGDRGVLEKYYPTMKHWLQYVDKYTVDGLLQRWPNTDYREWYLGDWATPTGINQTDPASITLVDNCVISECYIYLEKIARLLGKDDEAKDFAERKNRLDSIIHATFYKPDSAVYATATQIDNIYPMLAGVTPSQLVPSVTNSVFSLTAGKYKGHLATGLVGIPVLVEWAVKNNCPDFVYGMLKQRDYPGYLYMLAQGGTATWEHWNGERSRLHNCYNGIGAWFYQAIGGIQPVEEAPGYRKIRICPQVPNGITWAKVTKDTPYGAVTVHWELKDGKLHTDVKAPADCEVEIIE